MASFQLSVLMLSPKIWTFELTLNASASFARRNGLCKLAINLNELALPSERPVVRSREFQFTWLRRSMKKWIPLRKSLRKPLKIAAIDVYRLKNLWR